MRRLQQEPSSQPPPPPPPQQQQQQQRGGGGGGGGEIVIAKLDLHGYQKLPAIREVTNFLEDCCRQNNVTTKKKKNRKKKNKKKKEGDDINNKNTNTNTTTHYDDQPIWVTIITGTGSHSPHGSILRTAVEQLLIKREIQYRLDPGKASFTVNANSGYVLYQSNQTEPSTKLLVKSAQEVETTPTSVVADGATQIVPFTRSSSTTTTKTTIPEAKENTTTMHLNIEDQLLMEQIKRKTLAEYSENEKLEEQMQLAISLSQRQQEYEEENDKNQIQLAIALSAQQQQQQQHEDDQQLKKALRLSSKHYEYQKESAEQQQLQNIMKLSQLDYDQHVLSQSQMEKQLQEAINRSLQEAQQNETTTTTSTGTAATITNTTPSSTRTKNKAISSPSQCLENGSKTGNDEQRLESRMEATSKIKNAKLDPNAKTFIPSFQMV